MEQRAPEGTYGGTRQKVWFGPGSLRSLGEILEQMDVERALVVTGRTLAAGQLAQRLRESAGGRVAATFDGTVAHAPRSSAEAGRAALREAGADGIVTLGGGSAVDVARGILLLEACAGDLSQFPDDRRLRDTPTLPFTTVATTLSQAEFSYVSALTDDETGEKILRFDLGVMPDWVILDAEATTETPERLWISSGIKALDTTIDMYLQYVDGQPFWDAMLLQAAATLVALLDADADAGDPTVRQRLQVAAWMGEYPRFHLPTDRTARPAARWFGAAARHQLGGAYRAPHGELSAVLLPGSLAFHREETRHRQDSLGRAVGGADGTDLPGILERLSSSRGLPTRLGELGVDASRLPGVVDAIAHEEPSLAGRRDEMLAILTRLL